ncbi:MAG: LacI family DNA-binding transcriptional regulator, partial [Rhizobacter sp.]|nr:LacI family DNA-binding transcriptional regulator [Rhizobacter sp.]
MTPPDPPSSRRQRRGAGGITLGDVARLAGVSPITASRALNTPDQVAKETLQRVLEAVSRTGYVPNRLAGGLASARSRLVAAVVPTITGPVFMQMVESLTASLADAGYQLMLGQSGYTQSREDALLDAIIGRRPDGIVLTGIMHSPEGRRRLLASGIPVVETWDLTPTPIDMLVGFSHAQAGAAVAQHLHAKGRRRVALVSGDDERAQRRNRGFIDEALRLGLARREADI